MSVLLIEVMTNTVSGLMEIDWEEFLNDAVLTRFSSTLSAFKDACDVVLTEHDGTALEDFIDILTQALLLAEAASPDSRVLPGQVQKAKDRFVEEDAQKAWNDWFGGSVGTSIIAGADVVLAVSSLDDQSLIEFQKGQASFDTPGMPRRGDGRHNCITGMLNLVWEEDEFFSLAEDGCRQVAKATKQWSPIGMETRYQEIGACFMRLHGEILWADAAASYEIYETCLSCVELWDSEASKAGNLENFSAEARQTATTVLGVSFVRGETLFSFYDKINGFLKTCSLCTKHSTDIKKAQEMVEKEIPEFRKNVTFRQSVMYVCLAQANIIVSATENPTLVTSFDALYEDFKCYWNSSALSQAITLIEESSQEPLGSLWFCSTLR